MIKDVNCFTSFKTFDICECYISINAYDLYQFLTFKLRESLVNGLNVIQDYFIDGNPTRLNTFFLGKA